MEKQKFIIRHENGHFIGEITLNSRTPENVTSGRLALVLYKMGYTRLEVHSIIGE